MNIPFIKIQNLGNDYIYIEKKSVIRKKISGSNLARKISDRHNGVGADGLFIVEIVNSNSAFVEMINSDGSPMEFCGNGIRGAALYLRNHQSSRAKTFTILTSRNEYEINVVKSSTGKQTSRLRIGNPSFDSADIGYAGKAKNCLGINLNVGKVKREAYCLAMPNPHTVIFVDNFDFDWQKEGSLIEKNALFRNRTNVMFTRVESKNRLTVFPWERGAGATLSCGSGAAAAVIISTLLGFTRGSVSVRMPAGILKTRWDISENSVYQEGPSEIVCTGLYRF